MGYKYTWLLSGDYDSNSIRVLQIWAKDSGAFEICTSFVEAKAVRILEGKWENNTLIFVNRYFYSRRICIVFFIISIKLLSISKFGFLKIVSSGPRRSSFNNMFTSYSTSTELSRYI
jgi:hypothetical protein